MHTTGNGIYFAENASYSNGYASSTGTHKQMMLCDVLLGDTIQIMPNDSTLRIPPFKAGSTVTRHDSVGGVTGGSQVYISKI